MRYHFRWIGLTVLLLSPAVSAAGNEAMGAIMQDLSRQMVRISEGIWHEDYPRVAQAAEAIVEHPLPPLMERLELLARMGTKASRFMQADEALQAAALALKEAAGQQDMEKVMQHYQVVQQRCVSCHSWYRNSEQGSTSNRKAENE